MGPFFLGQGIQSLSFSLIPQGFFLCTSYVITSILLHLMLSWLSTAKDVVLLFLLLLAWGNSPLPYYVVWNGYPIVSDTGKQTQNKDTYSPHGTECPRNILLRCSFLVNIIQQEVFSTIKGIFDAALETNPCRIYEKGLWPHSPIRP